MTKLTTDIHPKLSDAVMQQLKRKHVSTVIEFIEETPEKLAIGTGLSVKDVLDIKRNISQKYGGTMRSALDLLDIEQSNIISTDLSCLDNLLNGGLYPHQIYELCGISSSGKTQLCFTIACNVAVKPNTMVRYINTKGDFCGSRVEQILLEMNYERKLVDEAMDRIKVCNVRNMNQVFKVLQWLIAALKEEKESRTRIIIIDSLPAVIFKFYKDHDSTIALSRLASLCYFIANEFRLSIITVNLITQWTSTDARQSASTSSSKTTGDVIPLLGKYWSSIPNTRLLIEKLGFGRRKLSVWKSLQLEQNLSCTLKINGCGVSCS